MKAIRAVVDQIVAGWHPDKIILFGSHGYGKPTPESDVDLLVIMPVEGRTITTECDIVSTIEYEFPMDLLVHTPEWIKGRLEINDILLKHWLIHGRTLYEAAD